MPSPAPRPSSSMRLPTSASMLCGSSSVIGASGAYAGGVTRATSGDSRLARGERSGSGRSTASPARGARTRATTSRGNTSSTSAATASATAGGSIARESARGMIVAPSARSRPGAPSSGATLADGGSSDVTNAYCSDGTRSSIHSAVDASERARRPRHRSAERDGGRRRPRKRNRQASRLTRKIDEPVREGGSTDHGHPRNARPQERLPDHRGQQHPLRALHPLARRHPRTTRWRTPTSAMRRSAPAMRSQGIAALRSRGGLGSADVASNAGPPRNESTRVAANWRARFVARRTGHRAQRPGDDCSPAAARPPPAENRTRRRECTRCRTRAR